MVKCAYWPLRPSPQKDESLASWFARLSLANGLRPTELLPVVVPGIHPSRRDIDRFACSTLIDALSTNTGVPQATLETMHFGHWHGRLYNVDHGRGVLQWFLPLQPNESRRLYGQQFCPHCLADDKRPYLRLDWRLSFVSACPRHRTVLIDRCPNCRAPLRAMGLPLGGALHICGTCGTNLTQGKNEREDRASRPLLNAQKALLDLAGKESAHLGDYGIVDTMTIFDVLRRLLQVLASRSTALPLRVQVLRNVRLDLSPTSVPRLREFHLFNPRARSVLVCLAWWLLQDWPARFVDSCKAAGITTRDLIKLKQTSPAEYAEPVATYFARPAPTPKEQSPRLPGSARWGTHRYWKLDGVSSTTRAAARRAARANGENVGAWVEKVLRKELLQFPLA